MSRRFLPLLATHSLHVVVGIVLGAYTVWLGIHESLSFCTGHTPQGLPLVNVRRLVLAGYILSNLFFTREPARGLRRSMACIDSLSMPPRLFYLSVFNTVGGVAFSPSTHIHVRKERSDLMILQDATSFTTRCI